MKLRINVTKKDIDNGVSFNSECCPIALATKRKVPHLDPAVSYIGFGLFSPDADRDSKAVYQANTPQIALDFIENFDFGAEVKPFSFEIEFEKM